MQRRRAHQLARADRVKRGGEEERESCPDVEHPRAPEIVRCEGLSLVCKQRGRPRDEREERERAGNANAHEAAQGSWKKIASHCAMMMSAPDAPLIIPTTARKRVRVSCPPACVSHSRPRSRQIRAASIVRKTVPMSAAAATRCRKSRVSRRQAGPTRAYAASSITSVASIGPMTGDHSARGRGPSRKGGVTGSTISIIDCPPSDPPGRQEHQDV